MADHSGPSLVDHGAEVVGGELEGVELTELRLRAFFCSMESRRALVGDGISTPSPSSLKLKFCSI